MKTFFLSLLVFSSALLPAMGGTTASASTSRPSITFTHPQLSSPLTEEQRVLAGLQLCRIHDRASADAAAEQLSTLINAGETPVTHWSQFGHVRFWEEILPTIAVHDYYGSASLQRLFAPLTTPGTEEQEAMVPYVNLVQDITQSCASLAALLEGVKDAETARIALAAVQDMTAQFPEWEQRANALPLPKGDVPFLLSVHFQRTRLQVARILRAWAQLPSRLPDADSETAQLSQALLGLVPSLYQRVQLHLPNPDKLSELHHICEAFLPHLHEIINALAAVTDKESADAAARCVAAALPNNSRSLYRALESFYPESEILLRQMSVLFSNLSQKEPPFYGSDELQNVFHVR